MKKNRLFFIAGALLLGVALFVSCQKTEDVADQELALKVAPLNTTDALVYTNLVLAGVSHQFCVTFPQDYKGNGDLLKTNANLQLKVIGDDPLTPLVTETEYWLEIPIGSGNTSACTNYTFASAGNYVLKYKASGQFKETTVTVISPCTDSFIGAVVKCGTDREVNFTFTSAVEANVKIQGGLTNFTTEGSVKVTVNGLANNPDYDVEIRETGQGSTNRIITIEGPASCTPAVINVQWSSTNTDPKITGEWTAVETIGGASIGTVAPLSCN